MVDTRTYNPRILSAATAVPPHRVEQGEIKEFARRLFADRFRDLDRLLLVFDNGEIAILVALLYRSRFIREVS